MSDAFGNSRATSFNTFLLVPILLFFGLLIVAVLRSPDLISSSGIGGAEIVVAPLILSTYALMAAAVAGRATVDLSIGPLIGFINVTLIQLNGLHIVTSPIAVFAYALFAGVAYQFAFALIVIYVRVQPIIVSLSGYLALSGLNLVILPRPGGAAPDWMSAWGAGTSIFSPVLFLVALATVGWWIFTATAFYGHLRLMGSDERAAYTSGVRITIVRLGAHVVAGLFAGLASLAFTGLISSGDPTQGTTYTLISVTALVLGGTSLAGGRASIIGSLLGALNLFLIGYVLATFNFGNVQGFVTDLSYGTILVLSLLLTLALPHLQQWLRYISPLLVFVVVGLAFVGVALHAKFDYSDLSYRAPVKAVAGAKSTPPPAAAAMPSPAALSALKNVDEMAPVFAQPEQVTNFARSPFSTAVAQLAILLLAAVVALRLLVWQASKGAMTPVIYAGLAFLALVGGWLLMHAPIFMAKAGS
jgi:ribose transport system permease protein